MNFQLMYATWFKFNFILKLHVQKIFLSILKRYQFCVCNVIHLLSQFIFGSSFIISVSFDIFCLLWTRAYWYIFNCGKYKMCSYCITLIRYWIAIQIHSMADNFAYLEPYLLLPLELNDMRSSDIFSGWL